MSNNAFLINCVILSVVLFNNECVASCDDVYDSETRLLKLRNDFSGWYKLHIDVWLPEETSKVINVKPNIRNEDLDIKPYLEYLINYPRNFTSITVKSVILNGKELCSNNTIATNGWNLTIEHLLTTARARLNSNGCGRKAEASAFFPDAPKPIETPWLVAIYANINGKYEYACAGNLITDRHFISLAQCFSGGIPLESFVVVMGTNSLRNWVKRAVVRGIEKAIVHEDYRPPTQANIALILLDSPINITNNLRPVCIQSNRFDPTESGLFSGWGSSQSGRELLQVRHLPLSIVKQEDCLRLDRVYFQLNSNKTFCVGESKGSPSGPCTGDHGGGFAVEAGKKWTLRGILAIVPLRGGQCNRNLYTVFIDVLKFKEWIVKSIETS